MKPDERELLLALAALPMQACRGWDRTVTQEWPCDVAGRLGLHPRRAAYLWEKWAGKGWYEWGVSARRGWLTEKGLAAAKELEGVSP